MRSDAGARPVSEVPLSESVRALSRCQRVYRVLALRPASRGWGNAAALRAVHAASSLVRRYRPITVHHLNATCCTPTQMT